MNCDASTYITSLTRIASLSRSSLRRSVASVLLSSAKIRSSRIKALLQGLSTPREMTSSTRSSKRIVGGLLSRDRSLRIRGTSSKTLESSSSKGMVALEGSSVERITSRWNGYIPAFLNADSIVEGLKHLSLARIYAEVRSTRRMLLIPFFERKNRLPKLSQVLAAKNTRYRAAALYATYEAVVELSRYSSQYETPENASYSAKKVRL